MFKALIGVIRNLSHDTVDLGFDTADKLEETAGIVASKTSDVVLNLGIRVPGAVYHDGKSLVSGAIDKGKEKYELFKSANSEIGDDLVKAKEYIKAKGSQIKQFLQKKAILLQIKSLIMDCKKDPDGKAELEKMYASVDKDECDLDEAQSVIDSVRNSLDEAHNAEVEAKKASAEKPAPRPSTATDEKVIEVPRTPDSGDIGEHIPPEGQQIIFPH